MPRNKSKWNDEYTGYHSKLNDPLVANRVFVWTYKKYCKDKMGKCKPIVAVSQKGKTNICLVQTFVNPGNKLAYVGIWWKHTDNKGEFCFKRNCREATQKKGNHEKHKPIADVSYFFFHFKSTLKCKVNIKLPVPTIYFFCLNQFDFKIPPNSLHKQLSFNISLNF